MAKHLTEAQITKIKALKKEGKTQRQIAKAMKIAQSSVSRWVNGNKPAKRPYKKRAWFSKTRWAKGKGKKTAAVKKAA